jgi:rfaE bifunctional protein nucleotidyltransferase chain/domain
MTKKIIDIKQAELLAADLKKQKKKIVLCHGTFDLLHTGHIKHMQNAKAQGDILFVSITADSFVLKGPGRPVFNEQLRLDNIAALESVDYVFINHSQTALISIDAIKPSYYAKGSDYKNSSEDVTGNIEKEINAVKLHGGSIYFTNEITFSSSALINDYFSSFNDEVKDFLNFFKKKNSDQELFEKVDSFKDKSVMIIGDAIVDEYNYVEPLGQTGKGNILSVNHLYTEKYAGGSIAVANHLANFAGKIDLVCGIGSNDDLGNFLKNSSSSNVNCNFFNTSEYTLVKKRYIDQDLNKYFEVYSSGPSYIEEKVESQVIDFLKENLEKYDLIVVPDFGNGFITNRMARVIQESPGFLAVNTQINSGNRGYHVIGKYQKANYISINEPEARLATHNKIDPIESIANEIKNKITKSDYISITLGKNGLYSLGKNNDSVRVPALSLGVVDRVGAGDAFLALSSISLASGLTIEESSFIGSIAAAIDVQIVCNKEYVNDIRLKKYISTLLK